MLALVTFAALLVAPFEAFTVRAPRHAVGARQGLLGVGPPVRTTHLEARPRATQLYSVPRQNDEDIADITVDLFARIASSLNRDLRVPALLVPPRTADLGKSTTHIRGWYALAGGLSLALGNLVYPASFLGYLYISRPAEAPDVAAAVAAAFTSALFSPAVSWLVDAWDLDESSLAKLPFLVGFGVSALTLYALVGEGQAAFVAPEREMRERMPQAKSERDLRFFDVKVRNNRAPGMEGAEGPQADDDYVAEVVEKED